MKIKGNEKYEFYTIQYSTSHSTQPNPTHGWTQPMSISGRNAALNIVVYCRS